MSMSRILEIATKAKDYARTYIKKGPTELVLDEKNFEESKAPMNEKFKILSKAIEAIRANHIDFNAIERVDPSKEIYYFDCLVEISKKYSIGNCNEFALLGLDYVLDNAPDINAACFARN